jgi:hypothetical protein
MTYLRELNPGTVICMALGLVVAINAFLVLALIRGRSQREIQMLRRTLSGARSPWKKDTDAMGELHQRVADLEEADDPSSDE